MPILEDSRWPTLAGGYGRPYDSRPALTRLSRDWSDADAWAELRAELHHQGDIGEASYAAISALVKIASKTSGRGSQIYALAATIETQRHARHNPSVPAWLAADYAEAWHELLDLALTDLRETTDMLVVQSALAAVALAKGATRLGALLGDLDESELHEILEGSLEWSEQYWNDLGPPTAVQG